ncbi:MAG: excinuclease ABC subunit UvrC [Acholeplasmatales bacterium]|jgi:excinuclease ABC, C subunit|nr:excinuclease ABC subunit UvrC [Acholeplasmatales bacterium]MDD7395137.1 excinuclease ABC subunit UvrC [Acholeplasmatales bacterium]MDY4016599.1 excinuclease ABC subunit UvrC [Bacilli bacterium]HCX08089.1 excinuclease ABC subunit C [Acholeplasmatales bacterium]
MNKEKILQQIKTKLSLVPKKPGCYQMYNAKGEIIYVGKAKILQNRLKSYFTGSHDAKTTRMLQDVVNFEYIITHSELEAFLLESNFIKKNRPKYNILLMDDKSYPYILITNEENPRLVMTRDVKKEHKKKNQYLFGPYPNAKACRDIVEILNKVYPFRKCHNIPNKACLYSHLNQCLAPCINKCSRNDYTESIKSAMRFLNGSSDELTTILKQKMEEASNNLEFEQALEYRDTINSINEIVEKQTMELNDGLSKDIFGYYSKDGLVAIQVLHMRSGKIIERSGEIFDLIGEIDEAILSYIYQFYDDTNNLVPKEIIIPYLEEYQILSELLTTKVIVPVKGIKKQLLNNVMENAKNNIDNLQKMRLIEIEKTKKPLEDLAKLLDINYPKVIELFDNSNIQGATPVSAMVRYVDGKPSYKDYRKYKVKTVKGPDDYHTMMEVIERRYKRLLAENANLPDMIIVDGGKTQVKAASIVLKKLNIENEITLIGLLKDDHHRTRGMVDRNFNEIFIDKKSDLFLLLEAMQDEVHRFAITFFKTRHNKLSMTSILDEIPGIGKQRKKLLLETYGTVDEIKHTTVEKLKSLGMPGKLAKELLETLNK